jgi:serine/threonine protein kinase
MWSVGCLAVVLLTGSLPFRDPTTFKFSGKYAQICDLEQLKTNQDWMRIGERPKDFVYRLLILDESQRMDVNQALLHHWFTNPAHKLDFDKVYLPAIKNWEPRPHQEAMIIDLDSYDQNSWFHAKDEQKTSARSLCKLPPNLPGLTSNTQLPGGLESTSSQCSDMLPPSSLDQPVPKRVIAPSLTLSDPHFPRRNPSTTSFADLGVHDAMSDSEITGLSTKLVNTSLRLPFSPSAWSEQIQDEIVGRLRKERPWPRTRGALVFSSSQAVTTGKMEIKLEIPQQEVPSDSRHLNHLHKATVAPMKED